MPPTLITKIQRWIKSHDKDYRYENDAFVFHERVGFFPKDYIPEERYVFLRPQQEIEPLEQQLIAGLLERKISAFKYAKKPLPSEKYPAIIVYATQKDRITVLSFLENLNIHDYQKRNGNPSIYGNW